MTNIRSQITAIRTRLEPAYPAEEADALAWWIMEELTGLDRTHLLFGCKDTKNIPNRQTIDEIIARLLQNEPIQYIFGHTLWNGLDLLVTPDTLIPRPETAELVEQILNLKFQISNAPVRVLDIGTGSGCIAIALKKAHPEWQVTGIDISPGAITVACKNARRNNVEIDFKVADIFADSVFQSSLKETEGQWLLVSNPPYICEKEKSSMRRNVLDYEPSAALFVPDADPLRFYRRIAELGASNFRRPASDCFLFFEINEAYPAELSDMLDGLGYTDIQIFHDIYGKPRIIQCRLA